MTYEPKQTEPEALALHESASADLLIRLEAAGKPELIATCLELARRIESRNRACEVIGNPKQAYAAFAARGLATECREELWGLYLNAQNKLIAAQRITVGGLNMTRSHPREILQPGITHNALGFILGHNHPSGSLDPSAEDLNFTETVRKAAELIGVELYDHLIVSPAGFTSLRETGAI